MNFQNLLDYCKYIDLDVFEGCTVPEPLDINLVKDNIMKRCGLLRPVYAEPDVFQALTKMWFDANQWNFDHLVKIIEAEYSPIENVYESDHYSTVHSGTDKRALGGTDTETLSGTDTETLSGTDTETLSGTDTETLSGTDTVTDNSATEHTVAAYNSSGYSPSSKDQNSGDIDTDYGKKTDLDYGKKTDLDYGKKTDLDYGKKTDLDYGKTDDFTHGHIETYDRLRHGNIGITTNDQLILEELSLLEKFNPYDWIAAKFERENFLQLY